MADNIIGNGFKDLQISLSLQAKAEFAVSNLFQAVFCLTILLTYWLLTCLELIWISTCVIMSVAERSIWQGFPPMFPGLLTCPCPSLSLHHFSKYCLKQCLPFRFSLSKVGSRGWPPEISLSFLSSPASQAEMDWAAWVMYRYVLYKAWDAFLPILLHKAVLGAEVPVCL